PATAGSGRRARPPWRTGPGGSGARKSSSNSGPTSWAAPTRSPRSPALVLVDLRGPAAPPVFVLVFVLVLLVEFLRQLRDVRQPGAKQPDPHPVALEQPGRLGVDDQEH